MEIENTIVEKIKKVKKVKKEKSIEFYFDEEADKKILEEYENDENDIMTISLLNNKKPWEVISLLVRYKIINSRGEAKGYNKYKETEYYKSKMGEK